MTEDIQQIESIKDFEEYERWRLEVNLAEKAQRRLWNRGKKLIDKYRNDDVFNDQGDRGSKRNPYHIFWSSVQTQQPALYFGTPNIRVYRRYRDPDPVGRIASEIAQRAITFNLKAEDFDPNAKAARDDLLIVGFGQCREFYEPTFYKEDGEDRLGWAETLTKYVHFRDFIYSPCRRWDDVRWVGFINYLSRDQLRERFNDKDDQIPLDHVSDLVDSDEEAKQSDSFKRAKIYEIWDLEGRQVLWLSLKTSHVLDQQKDPLGLQKFFPCPRPLMSNLTTDSLKPIADYDMTYDLAEQLKNIRQQIHYLEDAIRVTGGYDESIPALARILSGSGNQLIPIPNYVDFVQKGGLKGCMDFLPIREIAEALESLYRAESATQQRYYEITGMSDIIRGQGNPYETAEAQRTKAQFATLRLKEKQKEMQRFVRDLVRIKGEILVEHTDPNILRQMTGVDFMDQFTQDLGERDQLYYKAVDLLKDDRLRSYRIDIETDETISPDAQAEKQQRIELLTATTQFIQAGQGIGAAEPVLIPAIAKMITFGMRGFENGRELEATIEDATEKLVQKAQQPQEPPPDPQLLKVQADAKAKEAEIQIKHGELQVKQQELELKKLELQLKMQEIQGQLGLDRERIHGSLQIDASRVAIDKEKLLADYDAKLKELHVKVQEIQELSSKQNLKEASKQIGDWQKLAEKQPRIREAEFFTDETGRRRAVISDVNDDGSKVAEHTALFESNGAQKKATIVSK